MRDDIPGRDAAQADGKSRATARGRRPRPDFAASSPDVDAAAPALPGGQHSPPDEPDVDTDEIPTVAQPSGDEGPHERPHRRPVGLIIAVALLSALAIGTSTLAAYLWHVSDEWELQVGEITDVSYGLGEELATTREALAEAEQEIELLDDQLASSKDSVSRLQAENAQWGDDAAYAQEQIALLRGYIDDGVTVASSLTRCIEGYSQLVDYLENPDDVEEEELVSYRESVGDLCTSARDANVEFQRSVTP